MELLENILQSQYYGNSVQVYAVTLATTVFTLLVAYLCPRFFPTHPIRY